ncbi:MAG: glycosyltransferase domain-containing protein [Acidimicrobiales bacterium]
MEERRCVYTVLVGGYEPLLEQHIARQHDIDLICFTDGEIPADSGWERRPVELVLPADTNRSSRRPKLLVHEHLPDYDASLYIDHNVLLTVDPAVMFDAFLPPDVGMAAFRHSFRASVREEFQAVVEYHKEAAWVCDEQLAHYEATDPEALDLRPIAGGFLFRRHADPIVQATMQRWWEHVLRYSRRDQLSLRVAARACGLDILVHDVDNHLSPYHEWPRILTQRHPGGGSPLVAGPEVRIDALEHQVASLEEQLAHEAEANEAERARLTAEVDHAVATALHDVHRSTSWRITRPLRAAGDLRARLARSRRTDT